MLDDFREWLSDNLRYFMLGGAILLVLLAVIFGVRACAKFGKDDTQNKVQEQQGENEVTPSPTEDKQKENEEEETNPLETADADLKKLIEDYYQALGQKDVETLGTFVEELSPTDESNIVNSGDYIERYAVNNVYKKNGLEEDSFVVYAEYTYYCQGIDVAVPALSQFYVREKADGSFVIDASAEFDTAISAYTDALQKSKDVKALSERIQKENQKTLDENPELQSFLQGLGDENTENTENSENTSSGTGVFMIANDDCYVRDNPGGDVIGGIATGTEVEMLGETDGWIQIDYEGQTGYVYGELLDKVE